MFCFVLFSLKHTKTQISLVKKKTTFVCEIFRISADYYNNGYKVLFFLSGQNEGKTIGDQDGRIRAIVFSRPEERKIEKER